MDYHDILEVAPDASPAEIKSAYRKLAKQYHPDRTSGDPEATKRFKEIQAAYEVLSGGKKQVEDAPTGQDWGSFDEIFEQFFHDNPGRPHSSRGQHIKTSILLEFAEAASGCVKTLNIPRRVRCDSCAGTGARDGKAMKDCVVCDGKGRISHRAGFLSVETSCTACRGTGKVVSAICVDCSGRGFNSTQVTIDVTIPAGIDDGMELMLRSQGDLGVHGAGDLFCSIRIKPHPIFKRNKFDLIVHVPISYTQAVLGGTVEVPTLEGSCSLVIPKGTKTGTIFRLSQMGLMRLGTSERGDFLINVTIDVPKDISGHYLNIVEELQKIEKDNPTETMLQFAMNVVN